MIFPLIESESLSSFFTGHRQAQASSISAGTSLRPAPSTDLHEVQSFVDYESWASLRAFPSGLSKFPFFFKFSREPGTSFQRMREELPLPGALSKAALSDDRIIF